MRIKLIHLPAVLKAGVLGGPLANSEVQREAGLHLYLNDNDVALIFEYGATFESVLLGFRPFWLAYPYSIVPTKMFEGYKKVEHSLSIGASFAYYEKAECDEIVEFLWGFSKYRE